MNLNQNIYICLFFKLILLFNILFNYIVKIIKLIYNLSKIDNHIYLIFITYIIKKTQDNNIYI